MFESFPHPESQGSKLEQLLPQMLNELEARWRGSMAATGGENPYDVIDLVLDGYDLSISERLKAKNSLVSHMRRLMQ